MMQMLAEAQGLALQDFTHLYETEGPFELIHGKRIPLMPNLLGHSMVSNTLYKSVLVFLVAHPIAEVFHEITFIVPDAYDSEWVKSSRVPDVMLILSERLRAYQAATPDYRLRPLGIVPDIAVEVVSSNDSYGDVEEKVELYLSAGVQLVWVIDPHRRKVSVYEGDSLVRLNGQDTLTGGDVLPGYRIPVAELLA
jgi:Uma2 family endonuclease